MTTIIDGKVYYGGGTSSCQYSIFCYDPSQDEWTALPPLPDSVGCFGLGQVNDMLVTIGGKVECDKILAATDKMYAFDVQSLGWQSSIPMPTARCFPGVLSTKSALIVAGGAVVTKKTTFFGRISYTYTELDVVEIFKPDTPQWYKMNPLPRPCYDLSLTSIGNTCYALGGSICWPEMGPEHELHFGQALYASIDDLCNHVIPVGESTDQSAWKRLPGDFPISLFPPKLTAAVLDGNLLAIAAESDTESSDHKGLYMYHSSKNTWVCIGAPPATHYFFSQDLAVSVLSSLEILVINHISRRVHRGTPIFFE